MRRWAAMDDRERFRTAVRVVGAVVLARSLWWMWTCFGHPWPTPEERFFGAGLGVPALLVGAGLIVGASAVARFGYTTYGAVERAGDEPSRDRPRDRAALVMRILGLAVTLRGAWGLWSRALVYVARIYTLTEISPLWHVGASCGTIAVGLYALRGAPGITRAHA